MAGRTQSSRALFKFVLALAAATLMAVAGCKSGDEGPSPTPEGEGTVSGTIKIGPLCPVEPCVNPVNPYIGLEVVVRAGDDVIIAIPVREDGKYSAVLPIGEYSVDIQQCAWLGCSSALPVQVMIRNGQDTVLDLDIDTGIR